MSLSRRTTALALASVFALPTFALAQSPAAGTDPAPREASRPPAKSMKIRIHLEGSTLTATLEDNEAARDFAALLPLTLTLKDYAATEKISDLPKKLSTRDAPRGHQPSVGDITYYAPWGNLAVFYKDDVFASGLVKLGVVDSGIDALRRPGPLQARIERAP